MKKTQNNLTKEEQQRTSAIMHAVEVASSFQLYSYRIISHEQFYTRIKELNELFKQNETK